MRAALKVLTFVAVGIAVFAPHSALADDTTQRLRTSVARMNHWLGSGTKAQTWRKILDLNVLDSQTAKGEQGDPQTLRQLLVGFDQKHESLQHPVFREVRNSIQAQINQIDRTRTQELADLQFAARRAIAQFRKPTVSQLKYDRDLAKYELQVLKKVYRRDFDSKSRAIVFHKLKLNQTVEFLSDLEIEMPPEVSTGKMSSMISDERKVLEKIVDEIDALPVAPPEEDKDENESDLQLDIVVLPPGPDTDDGDDLATLETKKETVENRIKELRKKRSDVAKADRPRQLRRRDIGRELRRTQRRFRTLAKKQTGPAFAAAKSAMDRFADAYIFGTEDNIQEEYLERVSELAKLLPDLNDPNARLSHAKLGNILQWLEDRQQLRDLCVAVRRRYSNPNAYVSISSRLINSVASRTSGEYDRVAEDFLGRFARGLSYTNTTVNVVPVENPNQLHVSILLNGTASTSTYVRERSFRINSSAFGYLSARRDLFANLNGLWATPSDANASITRQYGGISSKIGLIQKIARESFAKEKGRTDAESSRRAKDRLQDRFDSETSQLIDDGIEQIETLATKARSIASFLPDIFLRSFSNRIEVVARKDTRAAIGATVNPTLQTAGSDVQLKLHDSMLSNYLDLFFAGRTFSQSELVAELKEFAGDVDLFPSAPGDGDEEIEEFKISFSAVRPVQIRFGDNRFGVTITGTRFEQGENAISTSLAIKLSFKIINQNGKLYLKPEGPPEIDLSEGEEPDAESIAFSKILEERVADAFEAADDLKIELPANLLPPIEQLEGVDIIKSLQLGLLEFRDGWLYLGWNYQGGLTNTPAIWNEMVIEQFDPRYLPDSTPMESDESESVFSQPILESDSISHPVVLPLENLPPLELGK